MNRHQRLVIAYLQEEVRVLHEQLGRRPRFNNDQRRRLALKAKTVGRQWLRRFARIVTPDTLLAWHRRLIAQKDDSSQDRMILVGASSLHRAVAQFLRHYHVERNHQGLEKRSSNPSFRCFHPKVTCAVANDSVDSSATITVKLHEIMRGCVFGHYDVHWEKWRDMKRDLADED